MKIFKKSLIAIALLLFGFNSYAQVKGGISLFEVAAASSSNNKIKINPGTSTTFKFRVKFYRTLNSNWSSGSNVQKYLFSGFTTKLSTSNGNGGAVSVSDEETVTNADFGTDSLFVSKVYEVTVNQSTLTVGNNIFLLYKPTNGSFNSYATSYGWVLIGGSTTSPPGGPSTPADPNSIFPEGNLVRTPDGKVYSIMDGLLRHITDAPTLYGVYNYSGNITDTNLATINRAIGSIIGPNTYILKDSMNGMLYFAEGNYIRYITSPAAANKYHFRISSNPNIYIANGVSAYTIGPPIY